MLKLDYGYSLHSNEINLGFRWFYQAPPFVMVKEDVNPSSPNKSEEFEGLSVDILEKMRETLQFNYKIYVVPDGKFGVKDRLTGQWNGIVKEIIDKVFPRNLTSLNIE